MKEYVSLLIVIYFLGWATLSLSTISVIVSINPMNMTGEAKTDDCEGEAIYFLYGWGITGIVLGGLTISLGILQTYLFVRKILQDKTLAWMFNISMALALGFFFSFGSFVTGYSLFKHCTNILRYYYLCIICVVFATSTGILLAAFLVSLYLICCTNAHDIEM